MEFQRAKPYAWRGRRQLALNDRTGDLDQGIALLFPSIEAAAQRADPLNAEAPHRQRYLRAGGFAGAGAVQQYPDPSESPRSVRSVHSAAGRSRLAKLLDRAGYRADDAGR